MASSHRGLRLAFATALLSSVFTIPAFAVDDPAKPGAAATPAAASGASSEVTNERLLNADKEPQNWLMVHKEYNSTRYSPLDQINKDNVKNLKVAFTTAIGGVPGGGNNPTGGLQATPLVNNGFMYVVDAWGSVYKIDVRDGKRGRIVWVMDPGVNKADVWIPSNRGVALYKNFVISVTGPGKVIWTNAETGEQVRSVQVDDPKNGYALTAPPLVIGNKLIVGGSGGDQGARDHVTALDADTGAQLWRTYSVPAPGEPGSETWGGDNNAWMHGGGAFWVTGSYDPETKLTLWGSGQPVPMYDPEYRPGDNLYTNSTLALDTETGKMKWYFQYTPGDFLDFDEVGSKQLINAKVDGQDRKLLGYFGRNGFYYVQDRTNGQFIKASQYVKTLNWTDGIDPKTGKPVEYDPNKKLQTYKIGAPSRRAQGAMTACPHIQGGVNMFPTSYSPKTGLSYGSGIEGCIKVTAVAERSGGKIAWNGGLTEDQKLGGSLTAMDPTTGERKAQTLFEYPAYSGVVSTGGGLVFTATLDGTITAHDDQSLKELWSFNVGSGISAPPMTYAVNGKQYVAILVGHSRVPKGRLGTHPEMQDLQTTSMLYVFSL
ncbi:PQQ-binding-like beta-propeller repeat protein [Alsobacter sp. SYSU M60028]|uniref:PQQ-binding-like beta-propeller repeat protein n=1 Tax=Alsobacter ponti TaxID=2962936 RepID=A0ABT1LFW9_9HYPH|nr:PQQ-binding-like beta-propeller repeat protein [Alsobacter ponti]MCP8939620.1 PQQ-binding-like beta-propeller repeat protein [Alsobacter ponti]